MIDDRLCRAISAVIDHLRLGHNDVMLPDGRRMPVECLYGLFKIEWAGPDAIAETPYGTFLVEADGDRFDVSA